MVVEAIWKERDLLTIFACNKALYPDLLGSGFSYQISTFSHSLAHKQPFAALPKADLGGAVHHS